MVVKQLEEGFVLDNTSLHAAERDLDGLRAMCGAGRIVQLIPGYFDPDDQRACLACSGRSAATVDVDLRLV
jgi:hypothetical protein